MSPMLLAVLLAGSLLVSQARDGAPSAERLVEEARAFLPPYDGEHRAFLTAEQRTHVQAATDILSAAVTLTPESAFARWWKGHAEVLLGEDDRNRGNAEDAALHYSKALEGFDRALELQPDYYWGWYARAMAENALDRPFDALADLDRAVDVANAAIEAAGADDDASLDPRFVRYKARQWRADTCMRVLDFDRAREEFRAFYAENGNNRWDLGFSIAETYLRERDFAGAKATYQELLKNDDYATYDSPYAQLGYLAGLLGDRETATRRLDEALERELKPGLYLRMWLWILATDDRRAGALAELTDFVAHPPADLSPWDLELGRFVTGEGTVDDFLEKARAEEQRRMSAAQPLDDLMCEAWFYAGLRWEEQAATIIEKTDRERTLFEARNSYSRSLRFSPPAFKWEWAFARHRMTRLPLGGTYFPRFRLEGDDVVLSDGSGGTLERVFVHHPGEAQSRRGVEALRDARLIDGDLVQWVLRKPDGTRAVSRLVL